MPGTYSFVVELKPDVPHSDNIKYDLDAYIANDEPSPGECLWTHSGSMSQECTEDTVHDNPGSFWSQEVRRDPTSFLGERLFGDEIWAALGLVYCEKHAAKAEKQIALVKLCRRSVGEPPKQTFESILSNHSILVFGSDDLKGFDFKSTGPSASLAPFKAGDLVDTPILGVVSDTRTLTIRNDGVKVHTVGSQSFISTREGLGEATRSTKSDTLETPTKPTSNSKTFSEASASSLSPNQSPLVGRPKASVSPRSRPSTPKDRGALTPFAALAWATMKGDTSFEGSVTKNAQKVADLLMNWQGFTDVKNADKKGWVYIVRDPKLDLVKIGFTRDCIDKRLRRIKSQCEATSHEWIIVEDKHAVPIPAYKLLEKLVHADLAPHRWYFDCACGLKRDKKVPGYTQHQEWFEITDKFALSTLKLWRKFLLQEPFKFSNFGGKPQLEQKWHGRLLQCLIPVAGEEHHSHDQRLKRWSGLLHGTALKSGQIAIKGQEVDVKGEEVAVKDEEVAVKIEEGTEANTVDTNARHSQTDVKRECNNNGGNAIDIAVKPEPAIDYEKSSKQVPSPLVVARPMPSIAIVPSTPQFAIAGFALQNGSSKTLVLGIEGPAPAVDHEAPDNHAVLDESSRRDSANSTTSVHPSEQLPSDHTTVAPSTNASTTTTDGRTIHLDFDRLFRKVTALLNTKKPRISERTILEDLISLRWPLACMTTFALHGPYVPATLSVFMWTIFLPFFVAELRGWY
ncbi:hypothetical protein LTR17_022677 [Elasticomyces elasticus]|nr:hypothetical protein LTR17_022677 [Elasticomyces elasticus]